MTDSNIKKNNARILRILSDYINFIPDAVDANMIKETKELCGFSSEEAFRVLFAGIADIYEDRELRQGWISKMFTCLDPEIYENDPYRKTVSLENVKDGEWEFFNSSYKPYEAFVFNDLSEDAEGRIIPQIGFFEREYRFPAVSQGGREWMLITPNEIETMKEPVKRARGKVTTYGLGLGYFAFMVSLKDEVESVTVVERDKNVIGLFEKHILPQFPKKEKIRIVCGDAFEYAEKRVECDFVFADIWHDPSDGCSAYLRFKSLETEGTEYAYWIENTIKYYL